ncbi:MAG: alpha/beta hydrolase [Oligoflexia bacterium]|nr:alpha/beta hydrolase [Oligoflexia bacterium]
MRDSSESRAADYFFADDGTRLRMYRRGAGPAVVLVPGWTSHWQDFQPLIERIGDRFTCYGWDARPHDPGLANPTIERFARDLQNLLDACELDRPILVGHSMGALLSWEYLRQFGDGRLSGLCIIDQSPRMMTGDDWALGLYGGYTEHDNAEFIQEARGDFPAAVLALIRRSRDGLARNAAAEAMLETRGRYLKTLAPEPWLSAWQSFVGKDYRDVLPTIRVPTFLPYGSACRFYGPRVAEYVHARVPGSELKMYENVGHSPHTEAPGAFARDFVEFFMERFPDCHR